MTQAQRMARLQTIQFYILACLALTTERFLTDPAWKRVDNLAKMLGYPPLQEGGRLPRALQPAWNEVLGEGVCSVGELALAHMDAGSANAESMEVERLRKALDRAEAELREFKEMAAKYDRIVATVHGEVSK